MTGVENVCAYINIHILHTHTNTRAHTHTLQQFQQPQHHASKSFITAFDHQRDAKDQQGGGQTQKGKTEKK